MNFEAIKMTLPCWKQFLYGMVINTYGVVRSLLSRCLNVRGAQDQRKEQGAREKNERGHACLSLLKMIRLWCVPSVNTKITNTSQRILWKL